MSAHKAGVRVYRPRPGEQLDFSSLPGPVGGEWSDAMGHRQKVRLNVLEVTTSNLEGVGGLETYIHTLNRTLLESHSVNIHALYRTVNPASRRQSRRVGGSSITTHPVCLFDEELRSKVRRFSTFAKSIDRIILEEDIDIVHLHSPSDAPVATASGVSLLHGVPLVVTSHGEEPRIWSKNPVKSAGRAFGRAVVMFGAHRTGVSLPAAKWLGRGATVLGSLCDLDTFDPDSPEIDADSFRKEIGAGEKTRIFLYPARIDRPKGQMDFAIACGMLRERIGMDFKGVIVGPSFNDAYLADVKAFISRNGLKENVLLLGSAAHERLRDMYAAADAVIFPTYSEGLGLTAVESLAMRTPVVAYETGGVPEVVRDGQTGILVRKGDVAGLADGVVRLINDNEMSSRFGRNGRQLVVREYSPKALAKRLMAIYSDLAPP